MDCIPLLMCMEQQQNRKLQGQQRNLMGDPLSPYIFVMCMEKLSHIICDATNNQQWIPLKASKNDHSISHIMFVDDLILFNEATNTQILVIIQCLSKFCEISSQRVNKNKSHIFFSKNVMEDRQNSKYGFMRMAFALS